MKQQILRIDNLSAISANKQQYLFNIDLSLFKGETVALMGLSGSGASLFIDILSGAEKITEGRIILDEKIVTFKNETMSRNYGIYKISEEQTLIKGMTIAENIFIMRRNSLRDIFTEQKTINNQASILIQKLGLDLQPTTPVGKLSKVEKQLVELTKAVSNGARIIIFDEAFASYNADDFILLKNIVMRLKKEGLSFVINCNYIEEARNFADRVIIFKDGRISKKIETVLLDDKAIVDYETDYSFKSRLEVDTSKLGDTALEVENIKLSENGKSFSFSVRHGEVLALLDIDPKERERLVKLLSGKIKQNDLILRLNNKVISKITQNSFFTHGIVTISDLGLGKEIVGNMSIAENLLLPSVNKVKRRFGLISGKILKMLQKQYLANNMTKSSGSIEDLDRNGRISLLLERWYIFRPEVLVLHDPFLFADIIGSEIIAKYIQKIANRGTAILVIASRPQKLECVCHKILNIINGSMSVE